MKKQKQENKEGLKEFRIGFSSNELNRSGGKNDKKKGF